MLHIFPTSRSIRSFYSTCKNNAFLSKALTIADFETKCTYVPTFIQADQDTRVLLMKEACSFESFKKLHIPHEFLTFLRNSEYIFGFFEELSFENKTCADLRGADVYGEFEEHISILEIVYENYVNILEKNKMYDAITFPKKYKINEDFLQEYDAITLHLEGFLNTHEWNLFNTLTQYLQVNLLLNATQYNQKMVQLFSQNGINLPQKGFFEINLNEKMFTCKPQTMNVPTIQVKDFSLRSLQIGYVFWQINLMVKKGINPENIVVITPDESFASLLKAYDKANNLNFAMGFSFQNEILFQKIQAIYTFLEEKTLSSKHKIKRLNLQDTCQKWQKIWHQNMPSENLKKTIFSLDMNLKKDIQIIYEEEIYALEKLLLRVNLNTKETIKLLLNRLSNRSIDDISGGKITVMGILETRGMQYDGVIIVDFNDAYIPRFSQKDMFLSSKIRNYAKLPTSLDRENLQRYYYHKIISQASLVALSYVKDEEHLPSRFLSSFSYTHDTTYDENSYTQLLLDKHNEKKHFILKNLTGPNDFFSYPLSASRLKAYLECPRCYYFQYILHIKNEQIPNELLSPVDVGTVIHESLYEFHQLDLKFQNVQTLHKKLCTIIDTKCIDAPLWTLEKEIWKNKLFAYCENEITRYNEGWRVFKLEKELYYQYDEDIILKGKIDRIDKHESGKIEILDYKTGKLSKITHKQIDKINDFQMQFYYLLASKYGNIDGVGLYDLNNISIQYETYMNEKLQKLSEILHDIKKQKILHYDTDESKCKYSSYDILCNKENL